MARPPADTKPITPDEDVLLPMRKRHLMLFNLYYGGHHAEYLEHLVRYWVTQEYEGRLDLVLSPLLLDHAPELARLAGEHAGRGVTLIIDEDARRVSGQSRLELVRSAMLHRELLRRHVQASRPDQVLLTYFDHAQLPLGIDLRFNYPVQFSGIYFRPTLHYGALTRHKPGLAGRINDLRKKHVLRLALHNPHFKALYCPDVFAPPMIEPLAPQVRVVPLPEPYDGENRGRDTSAAREELGVLPGRKALLLIGALAPRKGVTELLEALLLLRKDEAARISVILAGRPAGIDEEVIGSLISRVRHETSAQLITRMDWIPPKDVQDFFAAADLVLAPYQFHVGSSGVLIRASHTATPVLGSDYGMMGILIQRHRLGLTVDATKPSAIADGVRSFLEMPPEEFSGADEMRRFAQANTAVAYASTIFEHLDACL